MTDIEGNRLDGEWVNPLNLTTTNAVVSEFPSGNGNAGGNFNFVVTLLSGDTNQTGSVNFTDYQIFLVNYGGMTGMLFTQGDFNGDGAVNSLDYSLFVVNYGSTMSFVWVGADLNGDMTVDQTDLDTLVSNLNTSNKTFADGDLNDDGLVNQTDLDLMFAQYGLELNVVS